MEVYMDHPIHNLLKISLENIKEMTDVNAVVGDPIKNIEGTIIIPISKLVMGFAAGGSEFSPSKEKMPFGGGTGGSLSINPIAFLVVKDNEIKLLHLEQGTHVYETMIEKVPELANKAISLIEHRTEV